MSDKVFKFDYSPYQHLISKYKVGIATSMWNIDITSELKKGALESLLAMGVSKSHIESIDIPGAFELPLAAQILFDKSDVDAVICLGCVIKGDTPHFDYVCDGATKGVMDVTLKNKKPVGFGLITTLNEVQAWERTGGIHGHKGKEAAETVIQQLIAFENL